MAEGNPSLRAQWLGRQLRDLRVDSGIKMRDAARFLKRDPSTMSRLETGIYPLLEDDVRALLDLYGVSDDALRRSLLRLSNETWRTGWWDGYADDVEGTFIDYVWLESRATEIRTFDVTTFYGLLQTPDYAREIIRAVDRDASTEQVDRWIELRIMRQAILERSAPPDISMIVDEAILRRQVGANGVMAGQLRHLIDLAERPNIEVRVLPFTAGLHASPAGAFKIISLPEPFPEVACVESPAGAAYLEAPHVQHFADVYDQLRDSAETTDASIALLKKAVTTLE